MSTAAAPSESPATAPADHTPTGASPVRRPRGRWLGDALNRLVWSLITLVLATFAVFAMLELAPGDAASRVAGADASPELIAQVRTNLRLDQPFIVRYVEWLLDVARGDFGTSLITREPVVDSIVRTMPRTLSLLTVTSVISILLSLALGSLAALRRGRLLDRVIVGSTTLGIAIPAFWLGMIMINLFSIRMGWLPSGGYRPLGAGPWQWLRHLVMPALALTGLFAAEMTRQLRASLQDVMARDYILAARMKGLGELRLLTKHALKNAVSPVITVLGVRIAQLLGGTVIIERVFAINGMGSLLTESVMSRDIPTVLAIVVTFAVIIIAINLVIDASYPYFDPRLAR